MALFTEEGLSKENSREREFFSGHLVKDMKVIGKKVNSMDSESGVVTTNHILLKKWQKKMIKILGN